MLNIGLVAISGPRKLLDGLGKGVRRGHGDTRRVCWCGLGGADW